MPAFAAIVDMLTNKIVNVANPTNPQDAATKAYVDSMGAAPPAGRCRLQNTGTQSFPDGTPTVVTFNSTYAGSTAGMADQANNRIKALTAGLYAMELQIWVPGATTVTKTINLRINGVLTRQIRVMGTGTTCGLIATGHEWLAVNDLVDVQYNSAGAALSSATNTWATGTWSAQLSVDLLRT
jgi:hypothetical protein